MHLSVGHAPALQRAVGRRRLLLVLGARRATTPMALAQHPLVLRGALGGQGEGVLPEAVLRVRVSVALQQDLHHAVRAVDDSMHERRPTWSVLVAPPLRGVDALARLEKHPDDALRRPISGDVVHSGAAGLICDVRERNYDGALRHQELLDRIEIISGSGGNQRLQVLTEVDDVHCDELVTLLLQVLDLNGLDKVDLSNTWPVNGPAVLFKLCHHH
mmetsp:Transcript_98495/g.275826  ORF Transcript_98495/g.275826 Transcript_98495/m.275826 type:complete len:216 (-) Transcript_98495:1480-2127(-)